METQRPEKKIPDDLSKSGGNSDPIPLDLIPEILKASPIKTLARLLCVSKLNASIICNRDFVKSYLIKSSTRPLTRKSLMGWFVQLGDSPISWKTKKQTTASRNGNANC